MPRNKEASRRQIYEVALALFRTEGFEKTTMRRIAKEANVSLGAAYHHYASKEAIVHAYYVAQHDAHEVLLAERADDTLGFAARLRAVFQSSLEVRAQDRSLMRELAPLVIGRSATSAFSDQTAELRDRSLRMFVEAVSPEPMDDELKKLLAAGLWVLHFALLLYYAHDESPDQQQSRALVGGVAELVAMVGQTLALPMLAPMRERLHALLDDAGLLKF